MCITIWKPKDITLFEETLKNCWDSNPDGAGFMYAEDGKVHIVKGLMTYEAFMQAYTPHALQDVVLHFRISTHGKVDEANTHPFQVTESLGLTHNGIISNVKCDLNKDMSDTWHFVEKFAKPMANFWQDPAYQALVEQYVGFSKLIWMDGEGNIAIYNEQMGNWNSDCWFSNYSYQTKSYTTTKKNQPKNNWKKDILEVNDICTTLWNETAIGHSGLTIPKGSTVRIESFGHGVYLWVVCIDKGTYDGMRCKISSFGLEKREDTCLSDDSLFNDGTFAVNQEVIFAENYNHFRIGDRGIVTSVAKDSVLITDPLVINDKKNYLIPKVKVRPALVLLN